MFLEKAGTLLELTLLELTPQGLRTQPTHHTLLLRYPILRMLRACQELALLYPRTPTLESQSIHRFQKFPKLVPA